MTPRTRSARILVTAWGGVILLGLTGCGAGVSAAAPTESQGAAVTIENCGRSVVVPEPPSAVVGLHPSQTELLLRLGLADRLVGQAQATVQALPDDVAALAVGIRVLGADTPPNREALLAAEITPEALAAAAPDAVVFAATDPAHEAAARAYLTETFPDMPAVRDDRLIAISTSDTFPGTLGNISVVHRIAQALYPDAFA
jgi:iron complex transport system substrate-binding protein